MRTVITDGIVVQPGAAFRSEDVFRCPGGIPGVETRLPLLFSEGVLQNWLSLERLAEVTSANPASGHGLYALRRPRRARLAEGRLGSRAAGHQKSWSFRPENRYIRKTRSAGCFVKYTASHITIPEGVPSWPRLA